VFLCGVLISKSNKQIGQGIKAQKAKKPVSARDREHLAMLNPFRAASRVKRKEKGFATWPLKTFFSFSFLSLLSSSSSCLNRRDFFPCACVIVQFVQFVQF